ncbi:hypothetical protein LA080_003606 [Diaporthe eres]|nr:hypothetical protein LA080_003606 [Diaporthe eres]
MWGPAPPSPLLAPFRKRGHKHDHPEKSTAKGGTTTRMPSGRLSISSVRNPAWAVAGPSPQTDGDTRGAVDAASRTVLSLLILHRETEALWQSMAARTGTPSMPSVLPVAAALAAAAASRSRKQQPGRQDCFPGRMTTQTFKAETLVRDYDRPGGSAAMCPQPATRRNLSHQLISMVGVPEWHELGNTLDIFSPLPLLITSAGVHGPAKSKAMASDDGPKEPISAHRYHEGELGKGRLNFLS